MVESRVEAVVLRYNKNILKIRNKFENDKWREGENEK